MESITKPEVRDVPIFNLLSALEGHIINNEEDTFDTISGEVVIALPTPGECLKGVNSGSIVICGQQKDVVDKALETAHRASLSAKARCRKSTSVCPARRALSPRPATLTVRQ